MKLLQSVVLSEQLVVLVLVLDLLVSVYLKLLSYDVLLVYFKISGSKEFVKSFLVQALPNELRVYIFYVHLKVSYL